jgi:hypothetical protein
MSFIEIHNQKGNHTGILSEIPVSHYRLSSLTDVKSNCRKAIEGGLTTNQNLVASLSVRAHVFDPRRFVDHSVAFASFVGYSDKKIKYIREHDIKVVWRDGAWLKGIFPATLNWETILFYYALLKLLAVKVAHRKRIPKSFHGPLLAAKFEKWLRHNARAALSQDMFNVFQKRLFLVINNPARDARLDVFLSDEGRWPNAKELLRF